jgi:predicted ABC-type ATPase
MKLNLKFRDFLIEEKERHGVFAFGRMNPITSGHEKLVNKVKEVAKKTGGSAHLVLSHSHDSEKNPLSAEHKIKHAKRAFPGVNVSTSSKEAPNFLAHAARLHKQGVTHLHMVAGSDRTEEYHKLLHKYNGVKGPHGYFNFKHIEVHSAGERDPDSEGTKGMSGTKMRKHAKDGNFKEFHKGVPSTMSHEHAKEMYHDVRKGMGLKESINEEFQEFLMEGVHDHAIFKAVFLAGGPGSGKDFVMKQTVAPHGMVEINSDKALEHLMDREKLDKRMPASEEQQRNALRAKAKSVTELREKLAIHGRNGLIINGTGDDPEKTKKIKEKLEKLGYETSFLHVHVDDHISRERNTQRGMEGGREVPEEIRKQKWEGAANARLTHKKMFGDNYIEFNNNVDLRKDKAPKEIQAPKNKELDQIFKHYNKFSRTPVNNPVAKEWISSQLQSKSRPAKVEQRKPNRNSEAGKQAARQGLQYYGHGQYGSGNKVTHVSLHDRLVEKPKKAVNESFLSDSTAANLLCLGNEIGVTKIHEANLVGILRHPEHGKAYIWQKSEGGYNYDVEYANGKKETHHKSHSEIVRDMKGRGYKHLGESLDESFNKLLGDMNVTETQGLISEEKISTGRSDETTAQEVKEEVKKEKRTITMESLRKKLSKKVATEDFGSSTDEYITPALGATGEIRDKMTGKSKAFKEEKKKNGTV